MVEPVNTVKPSSVDGVKGFINRTWKSRFVRNVAVVESGTVFSAGARGKKILDEIARFAFDAKRARSRNCLGEKLVVARFMK